MKNTSENSHRVIVNPSSRSIIVSNFHEAACSIKHLNDDLKNDRLYSMGQFKAEMGHMYHHINFAWNIRGLADLEQYIKISDEKFRKWTQYPAGPVYLADV